MEAKTPLYSRHEALGGTACFLDHLGALARGRVLAALLGLALFALTAFIVEAKRRGTFGPRKS